MAKGVSLTMEGGTTAAKGRPDTLSALLRLVSKLSGAYSGLHGAFMELHFSQGQTEGGDKVSMAWNSLASEPWAKGCGSTQQMKGLVPLNHDNPCDDHHASLSRSKPGSTRSLTVSQVSSPCPISQMRRMSVLLVPSVRYPIRTCDSRIARST